MRIFLIIAACVLVLTGTGRAEEPTLKVVEMAVTTKVVKGKPIDSVHRISSRAVKALYCFTRVVGAAPAGGDTIKHVWYRDNARVAEYDLPLKGERWRTYSKKPVAPGDTGDWRVEVLDSTGRLLKTVKFRMN